MVKYKYDGVYERIKKAWEAAGYNNAAEFSRATAEFADRVQSEHVSKIPQGTIAKWKKTGAIPQTNLLMTVCNICDCDIEYLLGADETLKHDNADIHDETGLSEEAINNLRDYKRKADERAEAAATKDFFQYARFFKGLSVFDYEPSMRHGKDSYTDPDALLSILISFILSEKNRDRLRQILYRLCRTNAALIAYHFMDEQLRAICEKAYKEAFKETDPAALDYKEALHDNYDRILETHGFDFFGVQPCFENETDLIDYCDEAKNNFAVIYEVLSPEERQKNNHLDSQDFYSLIEEFRKELVESLDEK